MGKNKYSNIVMLVIGICIWLIGDISYAQDLNFTNIDNNHGLSQSTGEVIYQDKYGYIWIGTADGLNKYNGYEFETYRRNQDSQSSIANNYIICLEEDDSDNLWVGTSQGLSKINLKTNKIKSYYYTEGQISNNHISGILFTKEGDLLVSTSEGLNIYDEDKDCFKRIFKGEISDEYILSLEEDRYGDVWIGTSKGIDKINIAKHESKNIIKSECADEYIYTLQYDENGYMWAGTTGNGLYKIDLYNNDIIRYKHDEEDEKSIPSNSIRSIILDKENNIWIGTEDGLAKMNANDTFDVHKKNIIAEIH